MGREVQDEALRDVVKKLSAPVKRKMDMLLQDRAMDQNKNIVRVSATLAGIELVQFCANDGRWTSSSIIITREGLFPRIYMQRQRTLGLTRN